jgi:hypothetical protein
MQEFEFVIFDIMFGIGNAHHVLVQKLEVELFHFRLRGVVSRGGHFKENFEGLKFLGLSLLKPLVNMSFIDLNEVSLCAH